MSSYNRQKVVKPYGNRKMNEVNPALLGAVVQQLSIAQQQLGTLVNRVLAPLGLNISQLSVLSHLMHDPQRSLSVTELAADMRLNQPTTTKIVQHLVEIACLAYAVDEHDARRKRVTMTPEGMDRLQRAYQAMIPALVALFSDFDSDEIETLQSLLTKLVQGQRGA